MEGVSSIKQKAYGVCVLCMLLLWAILISPKAHSVNAEEGEVGIGQKSTTHARKGKERSVGDIKVYYPAIDHNISSSYLYSVEANAAEQSPSSAPDPCVAKCNAFYERCMQFAQNSSEKQNCKTARDQVCLPECRKRTQ